uniref:Replication-associated protein n=1 Tax=Circoviridae sp. TaxID=1954248 RepID=A0A6M3YU36_9VIRU|nr:MAG: replication associated protein [Circoviridae sp.]
MTREGARSSAAARKKTRRVRRYCFTLNNYTERDCELLKEAFTAESCAFAIVGKEVGENQTIHLQGYVHWKREKSFRQMKDLMPRAHIEEAKGSDLDNDEYCGKGGDLLLRVGEPSKQGKRSDLERAVAAVKAGRSLRDIASAYSATYVRYGRGLRELRLLIGCVERDFKTEVHVIIGPPGGGKSRWIASQEGDKYYKPRSDWWDGYDGQEIVVLDDFYGWIQYDELLRICDRYPHRVPVKGGYVNFNSRKVFISSNKHAQEWYTCEYAKNNLEALFRRFTTYKWCDMEGNIDDVTPVYQINY